RSARRPSGCGRRRLRRQSSPLGRRPVRRRDRPRARQTRAPTNPWIGWRRQGHDRNRCDSSLNPTEYFSSSRLLIVAGKGGVGKTVVTASLARAAALSGRSALIVEVEGKSG